MFANPRMHRLLAMPIALLAALVMVLATAGEASAAPAQTSTAKTAKQASAKQTAAKRAAAKKAKKRAAKRRAKKRRVGRIGKAARIAARQKGDPYRYGANGPGSFDCSGLTSYSFRKAGLKLPRTAHSQYGKVRRIRKKNARKGDLVFFGGSRKYHVGIYWGKNRILHAPSTGSRVKVQRIWTRSWSAGTLRLKR